MSEDIYAVAAKKWGYRSQVIATIEEFNECAAALARHLNGKGEAEDVYEELADASIMLEQMQCYFDPIRIEAWKHKKLDRLKEILE